MAPERPLPVRHGIPITLAVLLVLGLSSRAVFPAAPQPYKDRRVVEVLRELQRQGVRVVFSTRLVTPEMRVAVEPHGATPEQIITAMLAPHNLTLGVGLRGMLLVVPATSATGTPSAPHKQYGVIVGVVRDRSTRRPIPAAVIRVAGVVTDALTRDDGRFRLTRLPVGIRTLTVQASGYDSLAIGVTVSPDRTAMVVFQLAPARRQGRLPFSLFINKDWSLCAYSQASEVSSPSSCSPYRRPPTPTGW
jgi:hypothetical protein